MSFPIPKCRPTTPTESTRRSRVSGPAAGSGTRTATLDEPEHGLTEEVLDGTDVLVWWGHLAHDEVEDRIVDRLQQRVLEGMGLICLHSAHLSRISGV